MGLYELHWKYLNSTEESRLEPILLFVESKTRPHADIQEFNG